MSSNHGLEEEEEDVLAQHIVCHRGFHDPDLLDPTRPVENTLAAYVKAWKHFHLCECDITSSKDGVLFLCHDETYQRVVDPTLPVNQAAVAAVSDMTAAEIEQLKLLDGSKPTRLVEVLERAKLLGPKKKMVVELKKDKAADQVIEQLCALLDERQDLAAHVSVIMSFDLDMMRSMSAWKASTKQQQTSKNIRIMLLTEAPAHYLEENHTVCVDVNSPTFSADCLKIMQHNKLDGIYLEFQEEMISTPMSLSESKHQDKLRSLASQTQVGVWTYADQLDGLKTVSTFSNLGIQFVNSDLPDNEIIALGLAEEKLDSENCFDAMWLFCVYGR